MMQWKLIFIIIVLFVLFTFFISFLLVVKRKNINIWIFSYFKQIMFKTDCPDPEKPIHIYFAFTDHFEPFTGDACEKTAIERCQKWVSEYPKIAQKYTDTNGKHPKHTFFYPIEQYHKGIIDMLAELCKNGFGDIEVHLHHDNDNSENLKKTLVEFKEKLFYDHGLLRKDKSSGKIIYGFIHGNWALDNSRKDGRWCGVNNEISILKQTGCFADFTLPSAPSDTQTKQINSIYTVVDDIERPKSHNVGKPLRVGDPNNGDLLLIQGPLMLNWKSRWRKFFPKIENSEIGCGLPVTLERIKLWIKAHVHVYGQPNHIFIKVHSHGCVESNGLIDGQLDILYKCFDEIKHNNKFKLHYITAFEMYTKIMELHRPLMSDN